MFAVVAEYEISDIALVTSQNSEFFVALDIPQSDAVVASVSAVAIPTPRSEELTVRTECKAPNRAIMTFKYR